ncbi:MAG: helix-hairpin-helix domain-containing protein [Deltaproteobacteria bacterium]|nr:helix-hairpin-helix domain-containing protein [Deltaproteobacteria bacterium]
MRRWRAYFFTSALAAGLTVSPFAWGQQQAPKPATPPPPVAAAPAATLININSADEATLMSVKGIGKTRAKAIVEYRQKNGPFKSIDDLTKIKGIKTKSLLKFRSQLTI